MIFNIIYPLLFSLIPIFTFFSSNIKEVDKKSVLYIFLLDLLVFFGLWYFLRLITGFQDNIISGIIFYMTIWFYTPWYRINRFKSRYAYQYIIKYVIYGLITCAIIFFDFMPLILTIVFSIIIFLNIIYIISNSSKISDKFIKEEIIDIHTDNINKPDIYHIILDGYLGKETLFDLTQFNNSEFYDKLKNLGFHVYNNIYSNYNFTAYSIPSVFNMDYFDNYMQQNELNSKMYQQDKLQYGFLRSIKSKLVLSLKKAGYKIIIRGETIFTDEVQSLCDTLVDVQSNQSSMIAANTTIATFLKITIISSFFMINKKANKDHAEYILRAFNDLEKSIDSGTSAPTYCLNHILAPHPPFCFKSDGSINEKYSNMVEYPAYDADGLNAYKNHMLYINKLTVDAVSKLIAGIKEKQRKAVILIHGDHGLLTNTPDKPSYNTMLAVFKYKFDDDIKIFKDNMTLVNIMPYLINYIFKTNLPIHSNKFYFMDMTDNDYINSDVTDIISKFIQQDN